jgi:hypothetical protein
MNMRNHYTEYFQSQFDGPVQDDREIVPGPPEPSGGVYYSEEAAKTSINNTQINTRFLNKQQKGILDRLTADIKQGVKVPSSEAEREIASLSEAAQQKQIQLLKSEWPAAFDPKSYPKGTYKEPTNLREAEYIAIDWLVDNPGDIKPDSISAVQNKKEISKHRMKLARNFTKQMARLQKVLKDKDLGEFYNFTPSTQFAVNEVLDYFANIGDPEHITNRELTAINKAMEIFLDSGGGIIRGFAPFISRLHTQREVGKLNNVKANLNGQGITHPWGDEIDDWRRNFVFGKGSKTSALEWQQC